jgi:hypothetical protein
MVRKTFREFPGARRITAGVVCSVANGRSW